MATQVGCVGGANRIRVGEELEPGFGSDYDAELVRPDELANAYGNGERNEPVLITWRLAHNEPAAHELRLLVGQTEIEELLGAKPAGHGRRFGHALNVEW